jgi:Tol biopolymer transport system component/DNA-binding winged helix-turn-helix (wHTH) protein
VTVNDQTGDSVYTFGRFAVDPVRRTLCRDGKAVRLRPRTFDVLLALVEHRGELLDKDRFFALVWQDTIVEENNLARHVSTLRKIFHESGAPQYIVTAPHRGYRFVAPVEIVHDPDVVSRIAPAIQRRAVEVPPPVPVAPASANTMASGHPRTMRWFGLVAGLVIIASLAGTQARLPRAGERGGMPHHKLWQLTLSPGVQDEPAWSPNGEWIAYSSDRDGNADIWIQPVGQENPRRVTKSPDNDWQPAWSPDGRYIAFRSERNGGGLYVVQPDGTGERRIAEFGYEPRWSADSTKILFYGPLRTAAGRWSEIYQVPSGGGAPSPVLARELSQYLWFYAAWHPGDHRISIYGARRGASPEMLTALEDGSNVVRSEISDEVAARLREANVVLGRFVWAPLGDALLFEGTSEGVRNIWRIGVDPTTLAWNSTVERLTTGAELDTNISLSGDGRRLAFSLRTENTRLWSFPFDSLSGRITGPGAPFTAEGADGPYDVSPDGSRVVYRAVRHGKQELWQRTLTSGQDCVPPRRRVEPSAAGHCDAESHDGSRAVADRAQTHVRQRNTGAVRLVGRWYEDSRLVRRGPACEGRDLSVLHFASRQPGQWFTRVHVPCEL